MLVNHRQRSLTHLMTFGASCCISRAWARGVHRRCDCTDVLTEAVLALVYILQKKTPHLDYSLSQSVRILKSCPTRYNHGHKDQQLFHKCPANETIQSRSEVMQLMLIEVDFINSTWTMALGASCLLSTVLLVSFCFAHHTAG